MFDAYTSYEACKQNKWNRIGRELFLPGFKLTSKALPENLGVLIDSLKFIPGLASPETCQSQCVLRNGTCGSWSFDYSTKLCHLYLGGGLFGDLPPTSELCQDECKIRYDLIIYIQNH